MADAGTPSAAPRRRAAVLRSVSVVGVMTAFSRVLGLAREIAMAYLFGTSPLKSAFDTAFTLPNLFRRLFGEGALASAFLPVFSRTMAGEGREEAWKLASRVLCALAACLAAIVAGGIALTFPLARLLPPGSRWLLPLPMLRIMLPYALLICLAATLSGMLNALGSFALPSLAPFVLNAVWLAALAVFLFFPGCCPSGGEGRLLCLCGAILLAGCVQIAFQLPALRRRGFRFTPALKGLLRDARILRILKLMGPALISMGLGQINVALDKFLAYWADAAAPAALAYAERVTYLPLGMFATAFMTVLLPTFSRQASEGAFADMRETIERSVRQLGMIMAPCALGLLTLAPAVIRAIYSFRGGRFDDTSAALSARALAAYAPGLLLFSLQKVLTPAFHGMQDMKTPMRVSLWCLLLNLTLNILSVAALPPGWKHCGIAGSTVFTSLVNCLCLFLLLRGRPCAPRLSAVCPSLLKSVLSAAAMAAAVLPLWKWASAAAAGPGPGPAAKPAQLAALAAAILAGIALYAGMTALASRGELIDTLQEITGRKRRRGGAAPGKGEKRDGQR